MTTSNQKIALVIGGSRGMGKAIVLKLIQDGYQVEFTYASNKGAADEVASEAAKMGGIANIHHCSLESVADIRSILEIVAKKSGKFTAIINNGAVWGYEPMATITEESFARTIDVNLKGPLFLAQHAFDLLCEGGRLVMISSIGARLASPDYLCYSASKAGLNALVKGLAVTYGEKGITVNALSPGLTDTDMTERMKAATPEVAEMSIALTPMGRMGTPEDIAGAVSTLIRPESGWITGQIIECSGGLGLR